MLYGSSRVMRHPILSHVSHQAAQEI